MRVVVTRPVHSGDRTAERLAKAGHEPLLLPLTQPVHDIASARQALAASTGAIAVTSAEAIRVLEQLGPQLAAYLNRPVFAVGKATAEAAGGIGFATCFHSDSGGGALAELIHTRLADLEGTSVTYLAGSPRAPGFEARLAELQVPFRTVECYRMIDIDPPQARLDELFLDTPADAVLLYSRYTAKRFFELPFFEANPQVLAHTRLICLSEAVSLVVPRSLQDNTHIASKTDEDSLLALIGPTDRPIFI